jgi:hypothetical protein
MAKLAELIDAIANVQEDGILNPTSTVIYDFSGRKLVAPQKGINIIRYHDGAMRKVLVK